MSDEKHEEIRRLSSALTEKKKKSEGFSAATLLFELCELFIYYCLFIFTLQ